MKIDVFLRVIFTTIAIHRLVHSNWQLW